ncbi:hypothetical protein E4U21_002525 [Claviceps maximensis]|nr:hypothetical protein E4U21_002525 [Claviceps maximensis]
MGRRSIQARGKSEGVQESPVALMLRCYGGYRNQAEHFAIRFLDPLCSTAELIDIIDHFWAGYCEQAAHWRALIKGASSGDATPDVPNSFLAHVATGSTNACLSLDTYTFIIIAPRLLQTLTSTVPSQNGAFWPTNATHQLLSPAQMAQLTPDGVGHAIIQWATPQAKARLEHMS